MTRETPHDLYERQRDLMGGSNSPDARHVIVAGCGGTGSWVALLSAMAGVPDLTLYDTDTVASHNLNRLPFTMESIGLPKVMVLAQMIRSLRPRCAVVPNRMLATPMTLDASNALASTRGRRHLLVDCTDRLSSQRDLQSWAREISIPYLRVGCDWNHVTVVNTIPDWNVPGDEEVSGYTPGVPIWVGPPVLAAALAVGRMFRSWPEVSGLIATVLSPTPTTEASHGS